MCPQAMSRTQKREQTQRRQPGKNEHKCREKDQKKVDEGRWARRPSQKHSYLSAEDQVTERVDKKTRGGRGEKVAVDGDRLGKKETTFVQSRFVVESVYQARKNRGLLGDAGVGDVETVGLSWGARKKKRDQALFGSNAEHRGGRRKEDRRGTGRM